jgi:hypothetical protein
MRQVRTRVVGGRRRTSGAASGLPGGGTSRPPDLGGVSMGWERTKSNPPPHRNRSSIDARPRCGAAVSPRVRPDGSARTDSPLLSQTVPEAHGGPAGLEQVGSDSPVTGLSGRLDRELTANLSDLGAVGQPVVVSAELVRGHAWVERLMCIRCVRKAGETRRCIGVRLR